MAPEAAPIAVPRSVWVQAESVTVEATRASAMMVFFMVPAPGIELTGIRCVP